MKLRSYLHLGGEVPLRGETIDEFFRSIVVRHSSRDAVVSLPQDLRFTYGELDRAVEKLARGLVAFGIGRGDRIGIWSTDNAEWVLLQMATARIGAVLVNVNPAWRVFELEYALRLARVGTLVLIPSFRSSDYVAMVRELCPEVARSRPQDLRCERLPDLRRLILFDPGDAGRTTRAARGFTTWQEVLGAGERVSSEEVDERSASLDMDDPINIQFTSGTTGFPKAVVLTHHNILNNGYFIGEILRFTEVDRLCVPVPFYHCFGMVVSNLGCFTHGAALVIPSPHFDAGAILLAIEKERCTAVHGVPTMFIQELEHPEFDRFDLSSLRTGIMAGAPCPPEVVKRVMERMGCREILIGYGMTEASPVTHSTRPEDPFERRIGTVGINLPHQEVKVVEPGTGRILPRGEQGEVCFRGYHVMRGYFAQEEATREAIDDAGWLHSGDLGVMDDEGYLSITGRLKDMIIRGGENIYPAEIENILFEHPAIAEVAVFGVPDPVMGEEIGAWIKLHEGARLSEEEVRDHARSRLAHYKVPKHVRFVGSFPMTVTGKIQKFRIREMEGSS